MQPSRTGACHGTLPPGPQAERLKGFFTGGIEIDRAADASRVGRFLSDFEVFVRKFHVSRRWGNSVALKFRKLGRHRADGLYYPTQEVLVLDVSTNSSFAHEFGHLLDFRAQPRAGTPRPSEAADFRPLHCGILERMRRDGRDDPRLARRRGRLSWRYLANPAECFARAFEQLVAETLPQPFSLVYPPDAYAGDPLYFQVVPPAAREFFERLLCAGPQPVPGRLRR